MSESASGKADSSTTSSGKEPLHGCPTCGEEFTTEAGVKQHHYATHGESIAGVSITCDWCGEEETKRPSHVNDGGVNFCSNECNGEWTAQRLEEKVECSCDYCGSTFLIHPFRFDQSERHFCPDSDCYGEWQSDFATGENARHWKGGYPTNYGPNWGVQKQKAHERDNHTCQACGKTKEEIGREVDVHHIRRLKWFKDNYNAPEWYEKANRLSNLVCLCPHCHNKWEGLHLKPQLID